MNETILAELNAWVTSRYNGLVLTGMYTSKIDLLLRGVFDSDAGEGGHRNDKKRRTKNLVLIATGGYGRMEMAPFSDVDIMFLAADRQETATAERILYKLWDTGLDISHSFRTPDECIEEAF